MPAQGTIEQNDDLESERIPLLQLAKGAHPTPLPTGQLFALLLLMIAEPVAALSIIPYINEVCSPFRTWPQA